MLYGSSSFCRVPIFNCEAICPHPSCNAKLDCYGDQLIHFRNEFPFSGAPRTWRNDATVRLLASDLISATRNSVVEPSSSGNFQSRPDIKTLGVTGGTNYLDITFINPLTDARPSCSPNTLFNIISNNKVQTHSGFMSRAGPLAKVLSMQIVTTGGWSPKAHAFISQVADEAVIPTVPAS